MKNLLTMLCVPNVISEAIMQMIVDNQETKVEMEEETLKWDAIIVVKTAISKRIAPS